ncbi:MAG: MOSC domain-containing protein [Gammaproteobacteria bacterium]|nr:MOSC domain-containing protein [Gammaproteobacteria bacterium]MBU1490135.1 MOSC domain-containing protein [Gammaproteobacteria bacterium]MBU2067920.1 MOSC domain-containing protein [Gammaproteobacteria bacterium]MBU2140634.1 MOSC domain-containing protein [Gammaproteobacteria bacterium]MBU2215288.1 MOSC domain-containing protein [Gammaproteobacteria bacterium]
MLHLSGLYRYPLKSARGEALASARLDALGIVGDRRWMVVDAQNGRFLTQRLLPQMTQLSALWVDAQHLCLQAPGMPELRVARPDEQAPRTGVIIWRESFRVPDAGEAAAAWLSQWLERPCRLVYMPSDEGVQVDTGYAEIGERVAFSDGFPLLLLGQGSLDDLSTRVGQVLPVERFRPNLLISGADAYAEDSWQRIRIGTLEFRVVKPCSRCIITTLDPGKGERHPAREPLATLKGYREREGQVYFGQNLIACGEGELQLGAAVEILR